jgi:hypothetical protein
LRRGDKGRIGVFRRGFGVIDVEPDLHQRRGAVVVGELQRFFPCLGGVDHAVAEQRHAGRRVGSGKTYQAKRQGGPSAGGAGYLRHKREPIKGASHSAPPGEGRRWHQQVWRLTPAYL